jgi:hypothetical protein
MRGARMLRCIVRAAACRRAATPLVSSSRNIAPR